MSNTTKGKNKFNLFFRSVALPNGYCRKEKAVGNIHKWCLVFDNGGKIYFNKLSDYHIAGRLYKLIN